MTCSCALQVNCDPMPLGPDNPYGEPSSKLVLTMLRLWPACDPELIASAAAQPVYLAAGVGFCATETEFNTEQEAIREVDPRRSRVWKIKNPHSRNTVTGTPVVLSDTKPSSQTRDPLLLFNRPF